MRACACAREDGSEDQSGSEDGSIVGRKRKEEEAEGEGWLVDLIRLECCVVLEDCMRVRMRIWVSALMYACVCVRLTIFDHL